MNRTRRLALPVVVVLVGLAAPPAHATLEVSSNSTDGLIVIDKSGGIVGGDQVSIRASTSQGDPVYFVVSTNPIDFFRFDIKQGCSPTDRGEEVVCQRLRGKLNLAMGDGNDRVVIATPAHSGITSSSVNLGSGNNTYDGIDGADVVLAGSGNDDVVTRAGNDNITVGSGDDDVRAGSGDDDLEMGGGLDEARSEDGNDEIDDTFSVGFPAGGSNFIDSGSGNDVIRTVLSAPTANNDIRAGSGNDTVTTAGSPDVDVRGASGNDSLTTGGGDDTVDGGDGVDDISTAGGNDSIVSKESDVTRDAREDDVRCGFDDDVVVADLRDKVDAISDPGGGTCEEVDRSPAGETPHVSIRARTLAVSPTGSVNVLLRCPRGVRRLGCKGTLQLRIARTRRRGVQASRSRKVRYAIRARRRKTVTLRLSRGDVRTLSRSRRRGRNARGILVSVEKGRKGRKTTIRNPRLKLRGR